MSCFDRSRTSFHTPWLVAGALCACVTACSGEDDPAATTTTGNSFPTDAGGDAAAATGTTSGLGAVTGDGGTTGTAVDGGGLGVDGGGLADAGTTGASDASSGNVDGGSSGEVDAGPVEEAHVPPCIDDDADVVMIGDSYIDWVTHTFIADMRAEAGQEWPSYAVGGTSMATGGIGPIPEQLPLALEDNPDLKMIVMTGGGNDILVADTTMFPRGGECTSTVDAPTIPDCQEIVSLALDRALELMVEAADAGVTDVVYFFYPHIPGGPGAPLSISGPHPNEILDYALPMARDVCESALSVTDGRMKCHFVDMVPVFEGKSDLFATVLDGVHPNSEGSKLMAKEIWRVMEQECLAQPSGSGCCIDP